MALPLKEVGKLGIGERTHKYLARIARAKGVHINELCRAVLDDYVSKVVHDAKVVLGQDDGDGDPAESPRIHAESHGTPRTGGRR